MRVVFTFAGGDGHAEPLVPLARAARAAGHRVAFAGRRSVAPALRARGFEVFADPPGGHDPPTTRAPLVAVDVAREEAVLRDWYAGGLARARAERVPALCAEWAPDVVVCDEADFGAMVAAERLGLPHATVLVTAAGSFVRAEVVGDALAALRAEHGLDPAAAFDMVARDLVLSPCPPSFRDPAFPLPATAHAIRPSVLDEPRAPRPAGLAPPAVYFTLGTVFNLEAGDLYDRVLRALRDAPVSVLATVGRELDPAELGEHSPNVRVERYIPQAAMLPHVDAVVTHGGSGTVVGALAFGLPLVVLPMGADQPPNAARCEALGVGIALDAVRATPREIRAAVLAVLREPRYREAAERLRRDAAALPGPEHAVALLERVAR